MGTGCKIHIEVKDKDGAWHHYKCWDVPRDYAFFARIANVRNEGRGIEPITPATPQGVLPADMTPLSAIEEDRSGHTYQLLTGAELEAAIEWITGLRADNSAGRYDGIWSRHHRGGAGYLYGNGYKLYGDERHGLVDVRAICFFD